VAGPRAVEQASRLFKTAIGWQGLRDAFRRPRSPPVCTGCSDFLTSPFCGERQGTFALLELENVVRKGVNVDVLSYVVSSLSSCFRETKLQSLDSISPFRRLRATDCVLVAK
jgi:hypothetical protein